MAKITLNAAKLPKFKAINRKLWSPSPRTIVVIDLCLRSVAQLVSWILTSFSAQTWLCQIRMPPFKADVILRMRW